MNPPFAPRRIAARATLFVLGTLLGLAASPVREGAAAVPSPPFCSIDRVLVGTPSGTPVTCIGTVGPGFNTVIRDINNIPIAGARVALDFGGAPGPNLFTQQEAGTVVDCAARRIYRVTDAAGRAVFAARFGGFNNANSVEVSADGVILALVPARSPDVLATGGRADLPDFIAFAGAYGCANCPEFDFDNSGGPIGLGDFVIFGAEYTAFPPVVPYCW